VHGDITDVVEQLAERDHMEIVDVPLSIEHLGYMGDQTARHARNVPMLRSRIALEPDNVFCLVHLAATLLELGERSEARATFERAVDVVRAKLWPRVQDWFAYEGLIRVRLAEGEDVEPLLAEGIARFGEQPIVRVTRVEVSLAVGDHARAAPDLEALVRIDPTTHVGTAVALPLWVLGADGWRLLGECRWALGDLTGAARAFERSYALEPSQAVKAKLTVARARAGTR
jgi:tetratricopeptide (TPR) repeat protein